MSTSKSRDMDSISSLEEQLKSEISSRQRLELQLREQRSQVQWVTRLTVHMRVHTEQGGEGEQGFPPPPPIPYGPLYTSVTVLVKLQLYQ